jgi:hypothetical protein
MAELAPAEPEKPEQHPPTPQRVPEKPQQMALDPQRVPADPQQVLAQLQRAQAKALDRSRRRWGRSPP